MNIQKRTPFYDENQTNIQYSQQRPSQASFHTSSHISIDYSKIVEQTPFEVNVGQGASTIPTRFPNRTHTDNLQVTPLHTSNQHSMLPKTTKLYGVTFQFPKDFNTHLQSFLEFVRAQPPNKFEKLSLQIATVLQSVPTNTNNENMDEDTQKRIADSNGLFVELTREVGELYECYLPTLDSPMDSPDLPASHLMNMNYNFSNTNNNSTDNNKKASYKFKQPVNKPHAFDRQWRRHFDELAEFKTNHGHCNVSRTTKGFENLGNWLADQRRKLRRGKMTKEQYDMLTQLGVEWDRSHYFVPHIVTDQ